MKPNHDYLKGIDTMVKREIIGTNVPRLRTVPKAFEELKRIDPDTAMTMRALRRMVDSGEIPTISINSKKLINMDLLYQHFSCYDDSDVFCAS